LGVALFWLLDWGVAGLRSKANATASPAGFFFCLTSVSAESTNRNFSDGIWTGWLAFVFFILLAATSNDFSMKELGRDWKTVQRFVYLAAVLTLLHWAYVDVRHQEWGPAILNFLPVIVLSAYRIYRVYMKKQRSV
jgi:DMSO/TMAO reductase YedYZ heme-binding membrane subunit